jgi:hypothetical protein
MEKFPFFSRPSVNFEMIPKMLMGAPTLLQGLFKQNAQRLSVFIHKNNLLCLKIIQTKKDKISGLQQGSDHPQGNSEGETSYILSLLNTNQEKYTEEVRGKNNWKILR